MDSRNNEMADALEERRQELFEELFDRLHITSDADRAKLCGRLGQIGANLESNSREAQKAAKAPTLYEARRKIRTEANRLERFADSFDDDDPLLHFGTATDNPFADPRIRKR